MVPVTLSLGLINFNAVIDALFASRLHRPEPRADRDRQGVPGLHAPAGRCSRSRSRRCSSRRSRARPRARDMTAFRATLSTGLRQIGFLLIPASVVSAVLAEPIVRLLYQRGHVHGRPDDGRRRRARRLLARASSSTGRC